MWQPDEGTRRLLDTISVSIGAVLTLVFSSAFLSYCVGKWVWLDCGLRARLRPQHDECGMPRRRFFNMNLRLLMGLHVASMGGVSIRVLNIFTPVEESPACALLGAGLQFMDWLGHSYNLAIALWLFLFVFFGAKIRQLAGHTRVALELSTHLCCVASALFWMLLPLSTYFRWGVAYGPAGQAWCWMKEDAGGDIWRWAGLYGPAWLVIAIVIVLYGCVLAAVVHSHNRLYRRHSRSANMLAKFGDEMFLVIRKRGADQTLVRLSREWKMYMTLVAFPGVFLLLWVVPTVNRIYVAIPGTGHIWFMDFLHRLSLSVHGFAATLTYMVNPLRLVVRVRAVLLCELCCSNNKKEEEDRGKMFIMDMSMKDDDHDDHGGGSGGGDVRLMTHHRDIGGFGGESWTHDDEMVGVEYDAL